jgi:F-box protein 21
MNMLENLDNRQPTVNRRYTQEIHSRVQYKIGQVFRHRRYHYIGIINGWAANGATALPTPHYLSTDEPEEEADADLGNVQEENPQQRPSKIYYTCL